MAILANKPIISKLNNSEIMGCNLFITVKLWNLEQNPNHSTYG